MAGFWQGHCGVSEQLWREWAAVRIVAMVPDPEPRYERRSRRTSPIVRLVSRSWGRRSTGARRSSYLRSLGAPALSWWSSHVRSSGYTKAARQGGGWDVADV